MIEKVTKTCSSCETKYTITWNIEQQDLEPMNCPFCGFEVIDEEDGHFKIEERYDSYDENSGN